MRQDNENLIIAESNRRLLNFLTEFFVKPAMAREANEIKDNEPWGP